MSEFVLREIAPEATRSMRQAILRPHQTIEELATHEPPDAFAVGAFEGEELVAVGLIGPDGQPGAWRIRGMATIAAVRGRGAGSAVLAALLEHATAGGAQRVWCNARTPARSLYERAGLRVVSEDFDLSSIGPHYVMELAL
jgi:ribosomal protein S18 acetylase RimI-like enzyme